MDEVQEAALRARMTEPGARGAMGTADQAISEIVEMKPQKVVVELTLPVSGRDVRPVISLEWSREDTNMPLSELLKRIETYVANHGTA
jgi:hypothetical protein